MDMMERWVEWNRWLMFKVAMSLATMTGFCYSHAAFHNVGPIVPSQPDAVIHLWPTLMSTANPLEDLISFAPIDTPEQNFLPIGPPVEETCLEDIRGKTSVAGTF
jgi:hypothetical protein